MSSFGMDAPLIQAELRRERDDAREKLRALVEAINSIVDGRGTASERLAPYHSALAAARGAL